MVWEVLSYLIRSHWQLFITLSNYLITRTDFFSVLNVCLRQNIFRKLLHGMISCSWADVRAKKMDFFFSLNQGGLCN